MKKALVLAGGGTRGIYQAGAIEALREVNMDDWNLVVGTSVGALHAVMLVQHDFPNMIHMYENIAPNQFINGYVPNDFSLGTIISERESFVPSLQYWFENKGVDISPFYEMVDRYYNEERFFSSDIDFGCIAATASGHKPVYVTKEMMREKGKDWLVATASAYPAFPMKNIDGTDYVDGGYFDNLPVDYALRRGAEQIIAIDMGEIPLHPLYLNKDNILYIHPHEELFNFLDFDHGKMEYARRLGYNDTKKLLGIYEGERYTFRPFKTGPWFDRWMNELMMLETRIKLAGNLNGNLRSEHSVTDKLKTQMKIDEIRPKQYLYGMMDVLMDMIGLDASEVYSFTNARNRIIREFAECIETDYPHLDEFDFKNIAAFTKNMDRKGIVGKLIHTNFYPDHRFVSENMVLTLVPFEQSLADFVTVLMKSLMEE